MQDPPVDALPTVASHHPRPLLVSLVAAGWLAFAPLLLAWCLWLLVASRPPVSLQTVAVLASIALLAGALGAGLWQLRPWARLVQILVAVPLLCIGYTTLGALVLLAYFGRSQTKACFQGGAAGVPCWHAPAKSWQDSEIAWVVAAILLGVGGFVSCSIVFSRMEQSGFMR